MKKNIHNDPCNKSSKWNNNSNSSLKPSYYNEQYRPNIKYEEGYGNYQYQSYPESGFSYPSYEYQGSHSSKDYFTPIYPYYEYCSQTSMNYNPSLYSTNLSDYGQIYYNYPSDYYSSGRADANRIQQQSPQFYQSQYQYVNDPYYAYSNPGSGYVRKEHRSKQTRWSNSNLKPTKWTVPIKKREIKEFYSNYSYFLNFLSSISILLELYILYSFTVCQFHSQC